MLPIVQEFLPIPKFDCVVAIVDRQEDGEADAAMKESKLELISLFTLKDFINGKDE